MANSQFSLKGFLGGACKPPSRQVDPAEELNRVFEQYAKNVAAAENEYDSHILEQAELEKRYKKAVIAVRDSKDAVSMAQQEISSMETACLHLKAECKAKESIRQKLSGCVSQKQEVLQQLEDQLHAERQLFLLASEDVLLQLRQCRSMES